MTTALRRYVAKRTNATQDDPTSSPTVLGFVDAPDDYQAAAFAADRWGFDTGSQMLVVIPAGKCSAAEIQDAAAAETDARLGPSYGKRIVLVCDRCETFNYLHPRQPRRACRACTCSLPHPGRRPRVIDMKVTARELRREKD